MSKAYLVGAFDLFNVRHLDVIEQLGAAHDDLLVGVLDDTTAHQVNGRPTIVPLIERLQLLEHVRGVTRVDVHAPMVGPDDAVWYAVAGERVPHDLDVSWVVPRRDTLSAAVRVATAPSADSLVA